MAVLEAGTYKAKVYDYTLKESKQGVPMAVVQFQLVDANVKLTWYGSFSDKAKKFTYETLKTLGFKEDPILLQGGFKSGHLNLDTEHELVTTNETGLDGKVWPKIKFINSLNKFDALAAESAVVKMKGLNIGSEYKAFLIENGVKLEPKKEMPPVASTEEEIPF